MENLFSNTQNMKIVKLDSDLKNKSLPLIQKEDNISYISINKKISEGR